MCRNTSLLMCVALFSCGYMGTAIACDGQETKSEALTRDVRRMLERRMHEDRKRETPPIYTKYFAPAEVAESVTG